MILFLSFMFLGYDPIISIGSSIQQCGPIIPIVSSIQIYSCIKSTLIIQWFSSLVGINQKLCLSVNLPRRLPEIFALYASRWLNKGSLSEKDSLFKHQPSRRTAGQTIPPHYLALGAYSGQQQSLQRRAFSSFRSEAQ